jgi:hypothetical protein
MTKRLIICAVALLVVAGLSLTAAAKKADEGSWSGYVTDDMCAGKANMKSADCVTKCVKDHGGKYVLYSMTDKKAYVLDPQSKAEGHAGHYVTVKGTLDGDTIKVASLTMAKEPASK